jgi:beta-N-acetylhexosaminidase
MKENQSTVGVLMLDLEGTALTMAECELLNRPSVGGVILFKRNYISPSQLTDLTASIRECKPDILIAVDQEGGRVQRFNEGFLSLPALYLIGQLYARDTDRGRLVAES